VRLRGRPRQHHYPLFNGRIDDFTLRADFTNRSADITALDGLSCSKASTSPPKSSPRPALGRSSTVSRTPPG
jgi:hypothetical protein